MAINLDSMRRAAWAALLPIALAGCSGAPSEGQIKDALLADQKRAQEQAEAAARALGGGFAGDILRQAAGPKIEIVSVRKVGCKEDGEKAYRCDVEIEAASGGKTQKAPPMSLRFVKGSDGWVAQR